MFTIHPPLAARMARDLERFGVRPARANEVHAAHALAHALIGDRIASAEDLARVHARTGGALFVASEAGSLTGVLAVVLLNGPGHTAVLADAFDAVRPGNDHVAGPDDPARALYGWGVAAITRDSAQRVVEGSRAMGRGALAALPYYARPTTERGARLMRERMGFIDLPGSATGMVWAPPYRSRAIAA